MLWIHKSQVICGGSIYKPNVIITTGSCCLPFENGLLWNETTIIAAELVRNQNEGVEQARSIKSHKIHPDFHFGSTADDICLLELDLDFDFNGNVSAIELNTNEVILDPTSSCTIAGWGKTHVSIDCIEAMWVAQGQVLPSIIRTSDSLFLYSKILISE